MTRPPAECGTISAYARHVRHRESIDPKCAEAHADYMRMYRAALKAGPGLTAPAIGVARRIQALLAFGWTAELIGKEMGVGASHVRYLYLEAKAVYWPTYHKVCRVFDRLEMTRGPSEISARRARKRGWPPPLAWDPETIDKPETEPKGVRQKPDTESASANAAWHGTSGGYTHRKCRCSKCCTAWRDTLKKLRHRRHSRRVLLDGVLVHPEAEHGTTNAYSHYGCRCTPCADAWREYHQKLRDRRAAA